MIATRFAAGVSIAIPAIILCINRRLYLLASASTTIPSQAEINRELIIDLVIGIGLPIIEMILCLSSDLSSKKLYLVGSSNIIQRFSFKVLDL